MASIINQPERVTKIENKLAKRNTQPSVIIVKPLVPEEVIVTESNDPIITEGGDYIITE